MTCTTKRQARGAKREKKFPHSDRWQAQRGRKHEARSAEIFFFITRTDDEHNGGAGTRREARKIVFPYSHRCGAQRRREHEARSAKKFFSTLLSLETLEGAGTAPRKEKRKKRKKKKKDLLRSPHQLKFLPLPLLVRSRIPSRLLQSISRLALKGTPTKLQLCV